MLQDILTWIIVGVCIVIAVTMGVRRFRGKGKSCGCGATGSDACEPSADACAGCAIAELCREKLSGKE